MYAAAAHGSSHSNHSSSNDLNLEAVPASKTRELFFRFLYDIVQQGRGRGRGLGLGLELDLGLEDTWRHRERHERDADNLRELLTLTS